jgi:hypothetical protein
MKHYVIGFAIFITGTTLGTLGSQILFAQPSSGGYSTKMNTRTDLQNISTSSFMLSKANRSSIFGSAA